MYILLRQVILNECTPNVLPKLLLICSKFILTDHFLTGS